MSGIGVILPAVLATFGVVAIGFVFRWRGLMSTEAETGMLNLLVNVFVPCLILDTVLGNGALRDIRVVLQAAGVGFGMVLVGVGVAYLAGLGVCRDMRRRRTFAMSAGFFNYGFVALPLAFALFDRGTVGMLFIVNLGVEVAIWTVGVWLLRGGGLLDGLKRVVNMPLAAIVIGLSVNAMGWGDDLPVALGNMLTWLGNCLVPTGLLLTGVAIAGLLPEIHFRRGWPALWEAVVGVVVRQGILPFAFLGAAVVLPVSDALRNVLILHGAMPTAVISIVFARIYGGQEGVAVRVVLASQLAGLLTIPFWLDVGLRLTQSH